MAGIVAGRLAIVTGAGSGIGRAVCQVLAREGATVIATDVNIQTADSTRELIETSSKVGHSSLALRVEQPSSVNDVLKAVLERYKKPPTIIVNSAGITRDNFLLKLSEADFDEVLDVNLKGTFLVTQTFVNALVAQKISPASVVNISSISGKYGNIGQASYSATKAGVIAMTRTAAKEFGKFGVRCNCVVPGFIKTPMTAAVPEKVIDKILPLIPSGRMGEPTEVAEVITFLASERSSYVNGTAVDVTGGY